MCLIRMVCAWCLKPPKHRGRLCLRRGALITFSKSSRPQDGRAAEGSSRLKVAIHSLMGKSAAEDQLAALQVALGSGVSVGEVLA